MGVATSPTHPESGGPESVLRPEDLTWRVLPLFALLMVLAVVVPYEWGVAIPGVALLFSALIESASGAGSVDVAANVIAAIGVIVLASCSLTVLGILRRRPRLTLGAASIYSCQCALFFSGLQVLFANPTGVPRLVHPAVLLVLSGLGPVWLLPRLLPAYHATIRRVKLLLATVFALSGAMVLVFGLLPWSYWANAFAAMVVWTLSPALSMVLAVWFITSFPAHRVRVSRPPPATYSH